MAITNYNWLNVIVPINFESPITKLPISADCFEEILKGAYGVASGSDPAGLLVLVLDRVFHLVYFDDGLAAYGPRDLLAALDE